MLDGGLACVYNFFFRSEGALYLTAQGSEEIFWSYHTASPHKKHERSTKEDETNPDPAGGRLAEEAISS